MPEATLRALVERIEEDRRYQLRQHKRRIRTFDAIAPIIFNSPLARFAEQSGLKGAILVDIAAYSPDLIYIFTHSFDLEDVLEHLARPIYERFRDGWENQYNGLRWKVEAVDVEALRIEGKFSIPTDDSLKRLVIRVSLKDVQTVCKIKSTQKKLRSYDTAVAEAISRAAQDNTLVVYEVDCEGVELS